MQQMTCSYFFFLLFILALLTTLLARLLFIVHPSVRRTQSQEVIQNKGGKEVRVISRYFFSCYSFFFYSLDPSQLQGLAKATEMSIEATRSYMVFMSPAISCHLFVSLSLRRPFTSSSVPIASCGSFDTLTLIKR